MSGGCSIINKVINLQCREFITVYVNLCELAFLVFGSSRQKLQELYYQLLRRNLPYGTLMFITACIKIH